MPKPGFLTRGPQQRSVLRPTPGVVSRIIAELETVEHGQLISIVTGSCPCVQALAGRTYDPRLLTSIDEIAIFDSRSDRAEYRNPGDPLLQGGPHALHGTLSTVSSTSMEQLLAAAEQLGSPDPGTAAHLEPPNFANQQ